MTIRPRAYVDEWGSDDRDAASAGGPVLAVVKGFYRWCRWAMRVVTFPFAVLFAWAVALMILTLFMPVGVLLNWRRGQPLLPRGLRDASAWRSLLLPATLRLAIVPPRTGV
jgi:hypothetical protein